MWRYTRLALAGLLCATCEGSPTSPAFDQRLVLLPGPYRLVLYLATGAQTCNNDVCVTLVSCAGPASSSPKGSGIVPVMVSRHGNEAIVRQEVGPSTLVMTLRVNGDAVAGDISGSGVDPAGIVIEVRGHDAGPAPVTGAPAPGHAIQGSLVGRVSIGGFTCFGDQSIWRLEPGS